MNEPWMVLGVPRRVEHTGSLTPNADGTIEIMGACDAAAAVIARQIVRSHPRMDIAEVTGLVACELFYAAQHTAKACGLGVQVARA